MVGGSSARGATIGRAPLTARDTRAPVFDVAAAAFMLALTIGFLHHADRPVTAAAYGMAGVATLPLVLWRRNPVLVLVLTLAGSAALLAGGWPGQPPLGATLALFLLAGSRDLVHPWSPRLTVLVVLLLALHLGAYALGHHRLP